MKGFVRLIECRQMAKHGYQRLSGVKGNILAVAVMFLPCWQRQCMMRLGGGRGLDGVAL